MQKVKNTITYSFEETQAFGKKIAQTLQGGEIFALHGDLGSGKTTFVQGLAKGLGIEKKIISPTFIIVRTYEIKGKEKSVKGKVFYHIDLYRIQGEKDIVGLGLEEILSNPENIVAIEWPEKITDMLPKKTMHIFFEYIEGDKRNILIQS